MERFYQHCAKKCNKEVLNMTIHKAIFKYSKQNFTFEIIEKVPQKDLNDREKYWIAFYNSYKNGYNETPGGQGGNKPFKDLDTGAIIDAYISGKSLRTIGKLFNVDKYTIKQVLIRNGIQLRTTRTYKLCQEDRKTIMQEYNNGVSREEIQSKWGISRTYLSQLIHKKRRI